jgi:hypothetical protein
MDLTAAVARLKDRDMAILSQRAVRGSRWCRAGADLEELIVMDAMDVIDICSAAAGIASCVRCLPRPGFPILDG